jgi:hypothetical protein
VLLVFGDHQPHTFTSTGNEVQYDFNEFRRNSDKNITFFHIFSTASTRLRLPASTAPPATVLPTLVSSFLAKAPEDVYLGLNLWLYAHCGSDAVGRQFPGGLNGMNSAPEANRSAGCSSAYDRALAGYRNAGVFRFSFDTPAR